jgi:hypothetical protein
MDDPGHNDPASWDASSYSSHPVDSLEPLEPFSTEYRECALALFDVLRGIDEWMSACHSGPPRRWVAVSLALGLSSTHGQTQTAVASEWGVTRACISKDVVAVLRLAHLESTPAWGLKSLEHRKIYSKTNGRRRADTMTDSGGLEHHSVKTALSAADSL